MKIGSAFPSRYIKAEDLAGREHALNIASIRIEDVGGEEDKPVLYFVGRSKGCVLNRTNAMTIAARHGDDTDEWADKPVIIYPDTVMFQGKMVPCIRMRVPALPAIEDAAGDVPF
jgi:hypothetical protein